MTKPKPTTHVLMVIDKSGSMMGLENDVIGGFNTYINDLSDDKKHKYLFTVNLFDTQVTTLAKAVKPAAVPVLDKDNYHTSGGTALLDAVGGIITGFEKEIYPLPKDDRVLLVIQTDGDENSSVEYSFAQIKALIGKREATGQWSVVYLGAGKDTWDQASRMGVMRTAYLNTSNTGVGLTSTYSGLTAGTRAFASGASGEAVTQAVEDEPGATA